LGFVLGSYPGIELEGFAMFWSYLGRGGWRLVWVNGSAADLRARLAGSKFWREVASIYA
jgi:hypothetical protein